MARILVVDDSSIMRRNLSSILTNAGHEVIAEAGNGEQAYKEYERFKPDLVTMDITMPVLDGIGAVKKIIKTYPSANIIMISALDQKFMVLAAIQCGAKHYIIKPFRAEKVLAVVNEVIRSVSITHSQTGGSNIMTSRLNNGIDSINEAIGDINSALKKLDDSEQTYRSINEKNNGSPAAIPFSIENKDSVLTVNINSNIASDNFISLSLAVQGFLYVKPLKVILNFGDMQKLQEDLIFKIEEIIRMMKMADGSIIIATSNVDMANLWQSKLSGVDIIKYNDFAEVSFHR